MVVYFSPSSVFNGRTMKGSVETILSDICVQNECHNKVIAVLVIRYKYYHLNCDNRLLRAATMHDKNTRDKTRER